MKRDPNLRASARLAGDLLREERRATDLSLTEEFAASERDFEALIDNAAEPDLFERMLSWLRSLELPIDLLHVAPVAVRSEDGVSTLPSEEPGCASLASRVDSRVEIAFENHHDEAVWVVACEQGDDGSVSFVPDEDLSEAPCVAPGNALTFSFTPTIETTMKVVAIALRARPTGIPAEVLAEPARLKAFGVVATARFTLRVSQPSTR